ncbi:MHO_1590 family protein [Metamycoplasma hominis]|uniref:MHO_1590 family protein n=1 Tax=Metamycoplasma hominis TaxID=2098 RepID=UPI00193B6ECF|nr:hypothetical protein [Metamycoplasma hominis]
MLIAKKKKIIFGLSLGLACAVGAGALVGVYFLASSNSNKKANNLDNKKVNKKDSTNNINDNKNINSGNENEKDNTIDNQNEDSKIEDSNEDSQANDDDKEHKPEAKPRPNIKTEINWREIFPDVKTSDYYNQLNFKDGQGFIDKEMITYIIKDILNRMTILDGNVSYAYKQEDDQNLYIAFKWENKSQKSNITYKFSVNRI